MPVVVYLPVGWQYRKLGSVYDLSHARFSVLRILLLHRFVVFHFSFEVTEVFTDLLIGKDGLLVLSFLDFLGEKLVDSVAFVKAVFNLFDQVNLFSLHVTDLIRQSSCLPLSVLHVGLQIVLASLTLIVKVEFLPLNPFFVKLQLSFFLSHLVGQLLEHLNLLSSFLVHHLGLLGELRPVTVLRAKSTFTNR